MRLNGGTSMASVSFFICFFCNVMLLHMTLRILTTQKFMKSCFREQNMITQYSNHEETNLLKSNFTDEVSLYQEMNGATSGNVDGKISYDHLKMHNVY